MDQARSDCQDYLRAIRLVGKAKYGGSWDGTKLPEERQHESRGNLKDSEKGLPKDSSELMNDQRNEIGREKEARWETQLAWWGVLRENRTGQSRGFVFSNEEKILKSSHWVGEGWIPHLKHWSKKGAGSHFSFACSIATLYRWHELSLLSFAIILYKTSYISLQQILNW